MEFQRIEEILSKKPIGQKVRVRGWVYRKREHKNNVFILIRDSSGVIQTVVKKEDDEKTFDLASRLGIESSLIVEGVVVSESRAPGGLEIHVSKITPVCITSKFPITRDFSREYLLDVRHLWIRSRFLNAVLKVRSNVFRAVHDFFRERGFYEVHAPMFITAAVEGGATLFELEYVNKRKVYLTQSAQFYLEALIFTLEKVYTIAPSFRAEKSRTRRHLTEFWHAEAEIAWAHLKDIMSLEEELITYVIRRVLEENEKELTFLKRDLKKLENIEPPFYRLSYDEALEIINKKEFNVEWGDDFGADEERALTKEFDKPLFVYGFPEKTKAFYHKNDPNRPEVTLSADLLAPEGYGEIIGGGERIADAKELIDKIKRFGLDPKDYEWYIDLRRYGSVPHSGFGLGMDRLVMWICGLDHIMDAIPFPRTIRRVYP